MSEPLAGRASSSPAPLPPQDVQVGAALVHAAVAGYTKKPNAFVCLTGLISGDQASERSGDRVAGEQLPAVQRRGVRESRQSVRDCGKPGRLPRAAPGCKPGKVSSPSTAFFFLPSAS